MGGLKINKISKVLGAFTGSSTDPLLTSHATSGQVDTSSNTFNSLPDGMIWIGDITNVPVPRFISGDILISSTGVAAIGAGVIVNADVAPLAAIALTKLAPVGSSLALVSSGAGFIVASATSATQIGYLSTTTSDVQVQLDGKQATITGAASTVVTANLNPSIVAVTNGGGKFISSTTTTTALGFINNLSSDAQTQINTKLTVSLGVNALGDLLYYNGSNWTNFPRGTAGQVLIATGATIGWGAATASGLPVGGTAAQFLAKNSGVNFDASWFTLTTSLITDILATSAQINASSTYLSIAGAPTGTNGQALTISGGVMVWSNVGTGTVTSVNVAGGTTGLVFTGGPITTTGTITLSGTLATVNGGTNQTAVAIGDLLYGSGVNTWSRLPAGTNGFVLTLSAGVPVWQAPGGGGGGWSVSGVTAITGNTSQTGAFTNTFLLNSVVVTQNNQAGAVPSAFKVNGGSHTALTAGVEAVDVDFALNRSVNFATGVLALQRAVVFRNPTYTFVGGSTVADAATVYITGAPVAGSFALITTSHALFIASAGVGGTTGTSYGLTVNAQTGASNNYVAQFVGAAAKVFMRSSTAFATIEHVTTVGSWRTEVSDGGNGTANNQYAIIDVLSGPATRLSIQRGTGNVGIGTAVPLQKLTVDGIISTLNQTGYFLLGQNATTDAYVSSDPGKNLYLGTANQVRVQVATDGRVYIGSTASPLHGKLTIDTSAGAVPVGNGIGSGITLAQPVDPYGMILGIMPSGGGGYIQQQRLDGSGTVYALYLNPRGGAVVIPTMLGTGFAAVGVDADGTLVRSTTVSFDISNNLILSDGKSIFTGLITGTQFGGSGLQKLAFYGQTPNVQPTTAIATIVKVDVGGSIMRQDDTIGGYTLGKVVAALKQLGLLQ